MKRCRKWLLSSVAALGDIAALCVMSSPTSRELRAVVANQRVEMLAGIFEQWLGVCTRGNLNNHLGVPFTLMELVGDEDFAVIEMGAGGPNEIAI